MVNRLQILFSTDHFFFSPVDGNLCVCFVFVFGVGSFSCSCNQICHSFPSPFLISVLGSPHSQATFFGLPLHTGPPFSLDLTLSLRPILTGPSCKTRWPSSTPCYLAHDPIQDTHPETFTVSIYFPDVPLTFLLSRTSGMQQL